MKVTALLVMLLPVLVIGAPGCDSGDDTEDKVGHDDAPQVVLPIERDGVYVLELTNGNDTLLFECTAEEGGLITKFQLSGNEMISQLPTVNASGSTFWSSPQSDWNWPPPSAIGGDDYIASVDETNHAIELTSAMDDSLEVQVVKRFSADLENMAIDLTYTIINTSDETQQYAPWEVTRVVPGGLTFYPEGEGGIYNEGTMKELPLTNENGITWFDHGEGIGLTGDYKLFADGADGWLAHVQNQMIFVKVFEDIPPADRAPGEGEIELYVKGNSHQEIEQQGAYVEIPSGEEMSWTVKWYLHPLPAGSSQTVGDSGLVEFAASLSQR